MPSVRFDFGVRPLAPSLLSLCLLLSGCLTGGASGGAHALFLEASTVDGEPMDVLFRIGADGDPTGLEWSLDADGDGTPDAGGGTLPVEVVHSYASPGDYTARATLTGVGVEQNVTVQVSVTGVEPLVLRGTTTVVSGPQKRDTGYVDCVGFQTGQNGRDCIWFELDGVDGWAFKADSDGPEADVEFLTTCDPLTTSSLGMHVGNAEGTVPDGAGCALLWDFGSIPATMTLTLTP